VCIGVGKGVGVDKGECQKLLNLRVVKLIYAQCNNLANVNKIHYKAPEYPSRKAKRLRGEEDRE